MPTNGNILMSGLHHNSFNWRVLIFFCFCQKDKESHEKIKISNVLIKISIKLTGSRNPWNWWILWNPSNLCWWSPWMYHPVERIRNKTTLWLMIVAIVVSVWTFLEKCPMLYSYCLEFLILYEVFFQLFSEKITYRALKDN